MTASLEELTEELTRRGGRLEHPLEVAALLESMGLTDRSARSLGRAGIFQLSADIVERQGSDAAVRERRSEVEAELRRRAQDGAGAERRRGLAGAAMAAGDALGSPVVVVLLVALLLLVSAWVSFATDIPRATAVALAVVVAALVTGGFAQGSWGWSLGLAARPPAALGGWAAGAAAAVTAVVGGLFLVALLVPSPVMDRGQIPATLAYYGALCGLWVAASAAAWWQGTRWLPLPLAAGVGLAAGLREGVGSSLEVAHIAGIALAAVLALAVGGAAVASRYRAAAQRWPPFAGRTVLLEARGDILLWSALTALVLGDRVLAWTGKAPGRRFVFWFQPGYEAGMDAALLGLVLGAAAASLGVVRVTRRLRELAVRCPVGLTRTLIQEVTAPYRHAAAWVVVACLGGVVVGGVALLVARSRAAVVESAVGSVTWYAFVVAAASYVLIAWSILNLGLCSALSRPNLGIRSAVPALGVAFALGFVLSRLAAYWTAPLALLVGAAILWVGSTYRAAMLLRHADHHALALFGDVSPQDDRD